MFQPLLQSPSLIAGLGMIAGMLALIAILDVRDRLTDENGKGGAAKRVRYYRAMAILWTAAAICLACWLASGRDLAQIGLGAGTGWRAVAGWFLAAGIVGYLVYSLVQAARSAQTRQDLRQQFSRAEGLDLLRPTNAGEHRDFQLLSLTAGVTEEIVFRGFLIGVLALVWPLWLAALVSVTAFLAAHLYQGPRGMLRILPVTLAMTGLYVLSGALWPAIIVHVLVDATAGGLIAITDAFEEQDTARPAAGQPA
jgi:hypothetical protein